jgi:cysteinyl-tRNA synthetase
MYDDFNTPRALATLFEAARAVNRLTSAGDASSIPAAGLLDKVKTDVLESARAALGLLNEDPTAFLEKSRKSGADNLELSPERIQELINERADARKNKNFGRADEIRAYLLDQGILLEDGASGTVWKVKPAD